MAGGAGWPASGRCARLWWWLGLCGLRLAAAQVPVADIGIFLKANASQALPLGVKNGGTRCQTLFLDAREDATLPDGSPLDLRRFDAVLTDAADLVPWMTARPPLHYIDRHEYPHQHGRELYERKRYKRSMSVLVPRSPQSAQVQAWAQEAFAIIPQDTYIDDGTPESRRPAFVGYAFTVLLSLDGLVPPAQALECVAYASVPMLVFTVPHFLNYTIYYPYTVAKFRPEVFSPSMALSWLQAAPDDAIFVMQNSLMLVMDFFYFRYSLPFPQRLYLHSQRLCEEAALPSELRTDVFIAIYSAKANFARRRAARETWLSLLARPVENPAAASNLPSEGIVTAYRFFTNAIGAGDPFDAASSPLDDILRSEAGQFNDMVFLEALEEYPIGNMGRMALHWIANHTTASYILKVDDDMYIRPLPLLRHLVSLQRSMLYWGFFERSGQVVNDPESAHFLPPDLFGHDGVFPPYARGAALAMSLDLVRLMAHFDRAGYLRRLKIEDASYGYFLYQLLVLGVTSVTIADREEKHFALDPKCCTEQSHPNNCWSPLGVSTWIVHHVAPRAVRCMFRVDVQSGYYRSQLGAAPDPGRCRATGALAAMLPGDDATGGPDGAPDACAAQVAVEPAQAANYDPLRITPLPSLCECVHTPPPHPGRPVQGPLHEGPTGPRLNL